MPPRDHYRSTRPAHVLQLTLSTPSVGVLDRLAPGGRVPGQRRKDRRFVGSRAAYRPVELFRTRLGQSLLLRGGGCLGCVRRVLVNTPRRLISESFSSARKSSISSRLQNCWYTRWCSTWTCVWPLKAA